MGGGGGGGVSVPPYEKFLTLVQSESIVLRTKKNFQSIGTSPPWGWGRVDLRVEDECVGQ